MILSTTLFNIFLERIVTDALEDHEDTVSNGGRTITNLRFADDIDGLAGEEEEVAKLVECLNKASTAYGMEISAEQTKLMTSNTSGINTEIKVNGQKLETVTSFKYLGSVITDEGSKPEIPSTLGQTTAALTRLKPVCNDRVFLSVPGYDSCAPSVTSRSFCMFLNYGPQSRAPQNTSRGNEVLPQDTTHLIQIPCYQRGSLCQDPAGNRATQRPPDHRKETQTEVLWTCLSFIRSGQNHLAGHSERRKKTHTHHQHHHQHHHHYNYRHH